MFSSSSHSDVNFALATSDVSAFGFGCDVSDFDCDDSEAGIASSVIVFSAARFTFSVFSNAGLAAACSFAVIRDL